MNPDTYRQLRKKAGLTQDELADKLGIGRQTVNRRERGESPINGEAAAAIRHIADVAPEKQQSLAEAIHELAGITNDFADAIGDELPEAQNYCADVQVRTMRLRRDLLDMIHREGK